MMKKAAAGATARRLKRARADRAARGDALNAAIQKTVSDGILVVDDASTITEFNPAAARMFGRTRADALGRPIGDLLQPSRSAAASERPFAAAAAARAGHRLEMTARHRDGSQFPVEIALSRIRAPLAQGRRGSPQFAGVVRDISERKALERAALERERLSAFAWDVGVALTEGDTLPTMLERCARSMVDRLDAALASIWTRSQDDEGFELAASAGELASEDGADGPDAFKIDEIARDRCTFVTSAVAGDPGIDQAWAAANVIVSFLGYPLIVGERVVGVIAMFGRAPISDATMQGLSSIVHAVASAIERDRGEAAQARLAAIVEATPDLVAITGLDDKRLGYLNRAGRKMLGIGPQEPVLPLSAYRPAEFLTELREVILPAAIRDGLWSGETTFVGRDGRVIPVSQVIIAHAPRDGKIQLSTIARDITDRRRGADELRASDEGMRFALEAASMGVWELDLRTRRVTWTEMGAPDGGRRSGHFDGTEEAFLAATHVDDRDAVRQAIERAILERQDLAIVFRTAGPGGETRWVECRGRVLHEADRTPARIVGVSTDVTERKLLEAQLRQAQKMEAIGQLAGGVAHDFNNLLTAILGYAKFAAEGLAPDDRRSRDVGEIIKAAQRAAVLTRQLLAFSRKQVLRSTLVDLNQLVSGVSEMLRRLIGEHIALDVVSAPDLARVLADAGQLEQVVINLAVNARDAMQQGGRLTLETANVQLDTTAGLPDQVVVPGWYVMLAVVDTGVGMDAQTKRHLFEPFFTTKERGQGTGLGLATVYGIVKQSEGYIWAESEPGHGSAFRVYLPRTERYAELDAPPVESDAPFRGSETVLLVEDETGVRYMARRILEDAGYRVLEAATGREAEQIVARNRGAIDLLLTDVLMPGLSGPDLFLRLAVEDPGLKVIYISGYATEAMARQFGLDRSRPFLQKPFTATQLASTVRGVLDGRHQPTLVGRPA